LALISSIVFFRDHGGEEEGRCSTMDTDCGGGRAICQDLEGWYDNL
jgi:hypothetical protein